MRTWAKWLINHNIGFILYVLLIICIPLCIILGMYHGMKEVLSDWLYEWKSITRHIKSKNKEKI